MPKEPVPEWMPQNSNRTEPKWNDSAYTIKISRIKHREFEDGCRQTARKIMEWLQEECPEYNHHTHFGHYNQRKNCVECWQQFCKEAGL